MAKKPSGAKAFYAVLGNLRFDGDVYQPGDTVEMAESDAAELIEAGVIAPAPADDKKPAPPAK